MRKTVIFLLTVAMILAIAMTGCQANDQTDATEAPADEATQAMDEGSEPDDEAPAEMMEELPCRYIVPGSEMTDSKVVQEAITDAMKADGLNLNFEFMYIPWDVWQQKTSVMLSTGEEYELIHIMEDWIPATEYIARNGLHPISSLIDEYGPVLKSIIPEDVWDITKVNSEIYSIPVLYRDFALHMNGTTIQKHYFDKYDLPIPTNYDDLIDSSVIIQENEGDDMNYACFFSSLVKITYDSINRASDRFPFTVRDMLFFVDEDCNVEPWIETPEFKEYCRINRRTYEEGIVTPDLLTASEGDPGYREDKWAFNVQGDIFEVKEKEEKNPGSEIEILLFEPEKPVIRGEFVYMNSNAVPISAPNPEAGIMFFNWLYSSQENYDLLNYGIKDTHWTETGEREYEVIKDENGEAAYSFGDWEIGHYTLSRVLPGVPDVTKEAYLTFNEDYINMPSAGFRFDPSPVAAEYNAVVAEIESSIYPLVHGVISYEEGYEIALEQMNAAGYQEVVAEFSRQIQEWKDNQ
jgi:putative aldouronate transport system substrate-binding protein